MFKMTDSCLPCIHCEWSNEDQAIQCKEDRPEFPDKCPEFIREPGADDYLGDEE